MQSSRGPFVYLDSFLCVMCLHTIIVVASSTTKQTSVQQTNAKPTCIHSTPTELRDKIARSTQRLSRSNQPNK